MAARIARHRASRPAPWTTIEAPLEVAPALEALRGQAAVVIVDCLTLWVANLLGRSPGLEDEQLLADLARVSDAIVRGGFHALVVSNEVGSGVHPATGLGRRYRDLLGLANQAVARVADEVVLMIAGCPTWVKGER
jgi:adenosylcobinamide kinase/adenosylcobinamide-phosphate guanylyltransferase